MNGKKNLAYGIHPVAEAVRSGKTIDKVLVKSGTGNHAMEELLRQIRRSGIQIQFVPVEKLNRLTGGNHQGIVAFLSEVEFYKLEEIIPFVFENGKSPIILVLDGITDIRNFGAIARTAECAGIDAILIPSKGSVTVSSDAIKTSAGALHHIPVCKTNSMVESLKYMRSSGLTLIGATEKASDTCFQVDYTLPCALILGAEDTGISHNVIKMTDSLVKIPMYGTIKSLNVSVAASIIMYEALRQRKFTGTE